MKCCYPVQASKINAPIFVLKMGNSIEFLVGDAILRQKRARFPAAHVELNDAPVTAQPQIAVRIRISGIYIVIGQTVSGSKHSS